MQIETDRETSLFRMLTHIKYDKTKIISWDEIFDLIADKQDEYVHLISELTKQIEEKDAIIKRLLENEN